jgi:hypothetical protein
MDKDAVHETVRFVLRNMQVLREGESILNGDKISIPVKYL